MRRTSGSLLKHSVFAAALAASAVGAGFAPAQEALAQTGFHTDERGVQTLAPVLESVTPAVVNISISGSSAQNRSPLDDFFDFDRRGPGRGRPERGAGSGVIVDAQAGIVLTNHHVVARAGAVVVTLKDGRRFDAEVLGSDPGTDIAVLRISAENLTAVELGDSEALKVGDLAIAIGNPFGLGQTVTTGIVSALGRAGLSADSYEDFIQTDASINPGNSGGALITSDGKLIGINTAIIAPSGGNVGIGFAVPVNMARAVMDQILEYGEVRRGLLGVSIQDVTPDLAEALRVDVRKGAVVVQVVSGSAAEKADLRPGDIILNVDGERIDDAGDLRNTIGLKRTGTEVEIELLRDGEVMTARATIGDASGDSASARAPRSSGGGAAAAERLSGAQFAELRSGMSGYGEVEGVAIVDVEPGSRAERAGLRPGDVIYAVNQQRVANVDELLERLERSRRVVALNVYRDGALLFLVFR